MKKAELQAQLKSLGLSEEGTVKELKARLAGVPEKPLVTSAVKKDTTVRVVEPKARKAYRMSAHQPKTRRGPRNLQRAAKK